MSFYTTKTMRLSTIRLIGLVAGLSLLCPSFAPAVEPAPLGNPSRFQPVDALLRQAVEKRIIAGAVGLVIQNGETVFFDAVGASDVEADRPMTPDTIFRIASMTKPLTSVAVMMLVEQGHLKLDDPLLAGQGGCGLVSDEDKDGNDWIGFHPEPGSGSAGEWRGFPNAVYKEAGNYFHATNAATDRSITKVRHVTNDRVTITAESSNGLWGCQYDFFPTHCTFTMTRMPPDRKYWVLYEGIPGGQYNDDDWWITSAIEDPQPLTKRYEGHIPSPSWIAFGDKRLNRVLYVYHHEDDEHPDYFYQMQQKMTVFGFGRRGLDKFLDSVPQQFSIGFIESTMHKTIGQEIREHHASHTVNVADPG